MDLSNILDLFGYSVHDPKMDTLLKQVDAPCDNKGGLDRYDSLKSESLGVDLWFWWKGYYREQIGEPQGTVEPEDSKEMVLHEVRLTPKGLVDYSASLPMHSSDELAV